MRGSLAGVWKAWLRFARHFGDFQSRVFLTLFYFTILAPFALFFRLLADPLGVRRVPEGNAWIRREERPTALDAARREF